MNTGKYKSKITFIDKIENDDGQGGATITPADVITVWASVIPFNSNQAIQYNQLTTAQGYNIECRSLKMYDITTRHGIMFQDKILTIHSCDPVSDPMRIKIIAFEQ